MRKRLISLFLCLLLCLTAAVPALAATKSYIIDELAKLSADELATLNETAAALDEQYGVYVGLVMSEHTGDSVIAYLQAAFAQNAAGADGILLGYDPQAKKWAAYRTGKAETIFSEADEDALWELFAGGDTWYSSVNDYLTGAADRLAAAGVDADEPTTEQSTHRLCDAADLLTAQEESTLLAQLNDVSERQNCDVVVVTTNTLNGKSPMAYADDYYDEHGYRPDGVLLLVSMEDRDWYISTAGFGITAITDAGREAMADQFLSDLGDGNYLTAFIIYARLCDDYWTQATTGDPYDVGNLDEIPGYRDDDAFVEIMTVVVMALGIGVVVALIGTAVMKAQLKSVRRQPAAASYLKTDSLHITQARETFLYRHVNRVAKPQSSSSGGSSTHSSSSGASHGGGGGKF